MNEIQTGGSAFPLPAINNDGRIDYADDTGRGGMTLLDYFAAKALNGLLSQTDPSDYQMYPKIAGVAYRLADAMLAERNKR